MTDTRSHSGRTVIVTGGTKGIGRVIAEAFLDAGATVVVCARNAPDNVPTSRERSADFVPCDVRDADQVQAVVRHCMDAHGRLDVLINNAGGAPPAESASVSPRFNERVIALNLLAPITFAQAAYSAMVDNLDGGTIINICSVSGMRANPFGVAYGAAKAGLLNATETLGVEWAPQVRVVAITAGLILTEEGRAFYGDDESVDKVAATIPMQRMGTPHDIADACLFATSDGASWITGSNVVVHGGGERPGYLAASDELKDD